MHVDNFTINADGSGTIQMSEWMNAGVAATFAGATVSGSVLNPNDGLVQVTVTLTPSAPIAQPAQSDPGGSASADGA